MKVRFLQRNFRHEETLPEGLDVVVNAYSKSVYGGCLEAEIEIKGETERLFELINYLRDGVEIYDEAGNAVWWGYVERVEIPNKSVMIVADLDEMHNKVAVAYNLISAGDNTVGLRRTSAWVVDDDSIAKFGTKELLESGGSMNAVEALSMATRLRNEMRFPRVYVTGGQEGEKVAKVVCYGWWQTLGWRYCCVPTELALSFQTFGDASVELRDGVKIAQSFTATSDLNLSDVEILAHKLGSPGDIKVALCLADEDGKPGEAVRNGSFPALEIDTDQAWVRATFSEAMELTPNEIYFLTFESASSDDSNYQVIALDPNNGYSGGEFFEFADNEWVADERDMPFRLYNNVLTETSQQLQNYLTDCGQFFSRVFIDNRSGHYAESYRNGDTSALAEAEALLEVGTSNYRRLLARVTVDRAVTVYEEPEEPARPDLEIRNDNKLYYRAGNHVGEHYDPTGRWISIEPVIYGALQNATLTGAKCFFCESMEWSRESGLSMTPANWKNPLSLEMDKG